MEGVEVDEMEVVDGVVVAVVEIEGKEVFVAPPIEPNGGHESLDWDWS